MHLKSFQLQDYARLGLVHGGILAHDPGLGKTWAALIWAILKVGYDFDPQSKTLTPKAPVLIVEPGGLHQQFIEEAQTVFKTRVIRLDSQATFLRLSTVCPRTGRRILSPGYYITSYTQLGLNGVRHSSHESHSSHPAAEEPDNSIGEWRTLFGTEHRVRCITAPTLADLCQDTFTVVVVDEATKVKNGHGTRIGAGVLQLNAPYFLIETATPIKNRVPDLFWLAWRSCGGHWDGTARFPYGVDDKDAFAKTFCVSERNLTQEKKHNRRFIKLTPQVCNVHKMWKLMAPIVLRRRKKDIGEDIVGKNKHIYRVPMGTRQAAVYKHHLEWQPKDKNGKPAIGVQLQALRMAAAAPHSSLMPRARGASYIPKMAVALTLVQQILARGEQFILFSPFHDPLDAFSARLHDAGVSHLVADGRSSEKRRGEMVAQFKLGPPSLSPHSALRTPRSVSGLLASLDCMAEGHNCPRCNNVIIYSYPWALDKVIQGIDRAHRLNSIRDLNIYCLICDGTIDRKMETQIDEKSDAAELILDRHLLGEAPAELSFSELLDIAFKEFDDNTKTVDESALEGEWPQLRDTLRDTHTRWLDGEIQLPAITPIPAPGVHCSPSVPLVPCVPSVPSPTALGWRARWPHRLRAA